MLLFGERDFEEAAHDGEVGVLFQQPGGGARVAPGQSVELMAIAIGLAPPVLAQDDPGRSAYLDNCAVCHQADGRGLAGAFPPLVGWAAMTGSVDLGALYLFAIVFYWTPPHFWALALNKQRDYGHAGVPMMPNVHGVPETKRQMLLYTLMLVPLTVMPAVLGISGLFYGVAATLLGLRFLQLCWVIYREDGVTPTTWKLYKYSLSYLALLFVAMAVDRWVPFGQPSGPVQHIILSDPGTMIGEVGDASVEHGDH